MNILLSQRTNKQKRTPQASPLGGDRGVSLRTGGGGGSRFTAPSPLRINKQKTDAQISLPAGEGDRGAVGEMHHTAALL